MQFVVFTFAFGFLFALCIDLCISQITGLSNIKIYKTEDKSDYMEHTGNIVRQEKLDLTFAFAFLSYFSNF